jgi:hypothetical protein
MSGLQAARAFGFVPLCFRTLWDCAEKLKVSTTVLAFCRVNIHLCPPTTIQCYDTYSSISNSQLPHTGNDLPYGPSHSCTTDAFRRFCRRAERSPGSPLYRDCRKDRSRLRRYSKAAATVIRDGCALLVLQILPPIPVSCGETGTPDDSADSASPSSRESCLVGDRPEQDKNYEPMDPPYCGNPRRVFQRHSGA